MLFGKFWRVAGNVISLNHYSGILKKKHICKMLDNNNFHYTDKFFYIMIDAMVVTLYMYIARYSTINELSTWIGKSEWSALISKVEYDHLGIFTVQCIRDETSIKTTTAIVSMLNTKKRE